MIYFLMPATIVDLGSALAHTMSVFIGNTLWAKCFCRAHGWTLCWNMAET